MSVRWSREKGALSPHWFGSPEELKSLLFDSPPVGLARMNLIHSWVCNCLLWLEINSVSISSHQSTWDDGRFHLRQFCSSPHTLTRVLPIFWSPHLLPGNWGAGAFGHGLSSYPGYTSLFSLSVSVATSGRWFCCFSARILTGISASQPHPWGCNHAAVALGSDPHAARQPSPNPRAQNRRTHSTPLSPEECLSNLAENFNMLPAFPRALASLLSRSPLWFNVLDLGKERELRSQTPCVWIRPCHLFTVWPRPSYLPVFVPASL